MFCFSVATNRDFEVDSFSPLVLLSTQMFVSVSLLHSSIERTFHRGGGLPYIIDGDARRNFQGKPLKVTILGVSLTNFIS